MTTKPQTYWELTVQVHPEWADLWGTFCFEQGASGIETLSESETISIQKVFFCEPPEFGFEELVEQFAQLFSQSGGLRIEKVEELAVQDWNEAWKEHFLPIDAGEKITICPPWHKSKVPLGRIPVVIDPGQGFGTGYHPSTRLALQALEALLSDPAYFPVSMVDVGIGSGILAFAACHLGVPFVHGVDIEFEALENVLVNRPLNGLEDRVLAVCGGPECLGKHYPLVISNMLLRELLSVKVALGQLVEPEGRLILSGFLSHQRAELQAQLQPLGLIPERNFVLDGWEGSVFIKHRQIEGISQ